MAHISRMDLSLPVEEFCTLLALVTDAVETEDDNRPYDIEIAKDILECLDPDYTRLAQ